MSEPQDPRDRSGNHWMHRDWSVRGYRRRRLHQRRLGAVDGLRRL